METGSIRRFEILPELAMLTSDISWVREQRELVEKAIPVEKTTTSLRAEPYCDLARTAFGVLRPIDV